MTTGADLIDDLRDRLNDAADTQVPITTKIRFLNRGMAAMWPRIFRIARDSTLVLVDATYEYTIPATVAQGRVLTVELESGASSGRYTHLNRYDIIPSLTVPTLVLLDQSLPAPAGAKVRITSAERLTPLAGATYAAVGAETYSGPSGTEELPVLYAMGLCTARVLDDRMDYTRYSATQQNNSVDSNDIMQVSQFWFAQFELLLDRMQMPLPAARL
jgi:hypothetical protein